MGGYPDVWLSSSPARLLQDLIEAFLLRDASDRFRIERPDAFRKLMRLLAGQVGSLVNLSEWASLLGVSRDTVASYLAILEDSHIVATLPPYVGGRRAELTRRPKVFLVDNGVRNQLLGELDAPDLPALRGPLLENWAFTELWKALPSTASLHFWRSTSGAEVHFVVSGGDRPIGVEVKAQLLQRPRLSRSSRSFIEAYEPSTFAVLNLSLRHQETLGRSVVRWITPPELAGMVAPEATDLPGST